MKWEAEDTILLIDLYDYSLSHEKASVDEAIAILSDVLKHRATLSNASHFDVYFTETGLRVRLQHIKYIASSGQEGLFSDTPLDSVIFESYRNDNSSFRRHALALKKSYKCYYPGEEIECIESPATAEEQTKSEGLTQEYKGSSDTMTEDQNKTAENTNENDTYSDLPFYMLYKTDPTLYDDVPVDTFDLTVRVLNRLKSHKVFSVGQLFRCSPKEIASYKGIGKNSIQNVEQFLEIVSSQSPDILPPKAAESTQTTLNRSAISLILSNADLVTQGDFSFVDDALLSDDELSSIELYREAATTLGPELLSDCFHGAEYINTIKAALSDYVAESEEFARRREQICSCLKLIPDERKEQRAYFYIQAYSNNDEIKEKLLSACDDSESTIKEIAKKSLVLERDNFYLIEKFLKWCSFDINTDVSDFSSRILSSDRINTVIQMRSRQNTLEAVGKRLNLTRERVRQIEAKTQRKFNIWVSKHKILRKICALRDGDIVLTPSELEEYFGEETQCVVYLLSNVKNPSGYTYDRQSDAFIIGNASLYERATQAIENLPDIINSDRVESLADELSEENDIPSELIVRAIQESYKLTGSTYHRSRLSLSTIYDLVLQRYYPDGMKIYDADEVTTFRRHIVEDYGFSNLPDNDRAIAARIAGIGILCGRGEYKARQKSYLPEELLSKIHDYIKRSSSIVLTNTLFSEFEEELVANGVNNRYFLHGILREKYGDEFFFKKDYISKDGNASSLYLEIVWFIKQAPFTVNKAELVKAFPGVTDIMFTLAVEDKEVLNYFGEYLHASHLTLSYLDRRYLDDLIRNTISDCNSHHVKEFYDRVNTEHPELMRRNGILSPFSLFSLLDYLFHEKYVFSRPYIAKKGVSIGRPLERLKELVVGSDEISISEIIDFTRENHIAVPSILDLLLSFEETHVLKDNQTLIRIELVGVNKSFVEEIEPVILSEIGETTSLIAELQCIHHLKKAAVPWNEWILFGVLHKWSSMLDVATSNSQFRYATPVVSKKGKLNLDRFHSSWESNEVRVIQADDLDKIDELISDYVLD